MEGRDGGNSRSGTRANTVLTEIGPVNIEVRGDRHGTFIPQLVRKQQPSRLRHDGDLAVRIIEEMAGWLGGDRIHRAVLIDAI